MDYHGLIFCSEVAAVGQDPRNLARRAKAGQLVRVRRGVYVDGGTWKGADTWQRYGLRAEAFNRTVAVAPTFSLQTSGLLWGLALLGCPKDLHVLTSFQQGGRSLAGVKRHFGSMDARLTELGEFRTTDKARTAVELMARLPFAQAVAVADSCRRIRVAPAPWADSVAGPERRALIVDWKRDTPLGPPVSLDELRAAALELPSRAKIERATAVLEFSSDLSESAGESMSRANIHILGFRAPELQHAFSIRGGVTARTDFYWPRERVVGEFDGRAKYTRSDWASGSSVEERVLAEKDRENKIRALGMGFARWNWAEMMDLARLERILSDAGLRRTPKT
ncbi:type IV toxin-antitoxin system AbiEi family antitoxin domain-containing protein [Arthrobacter sp. A5]|uniref:type IV toxin-antitoxin system AbiEi family antitoxin domain-containing protein n=1 Tax=Arthrobacter sp. A5 TaxID=576926 RepID=UPI003DA89A93